MSKRYDTMERPERKPITIRPEMELYDFIAKRAEEEGVSLNAYLLTHLRKYRERAQKRKGRKK